MNAPGHPKSGRADFTTRIASHHLRPLSEASPNFDAQVSASPRRV